MEITFKQEEGCRKVYEVKADWAELEPRFTAVAHTIRGKARLPGFRPGKAPDGMLRSRFRKEIREEVLDHLLEEAAKAMVDKFSLKPVVEPYASAIHLEEGEPFSCELSAEEAPVVPDVSAAGLTIEVPKASVTEEQVAETLEGLRQRSALMKPVEEGAREGDFAVTVLRRKGQAKGLEKFFGALAKSDHPVERALVGKRAGEEFDLSVAEEPGAHDHDHDHDHHEGDEHKHAHLAPGDYVVTINKVVRREVPDLNDDLAKDLGAENLEALKSRVAQDLEARMEAEMKGLEEDKLIEGLLAKFPVPVPPTLVERQLKGDLQEFAESLARQGMDLDHAGIDWGKLAESRRPIAERKVAAFYVLDEVARRSGLEATEADVTAYIEQRTAGGKVTPAQYRAHLEKEAQLGMVKTLIAHKKAVGLLLSQASVTLTEGKASGQEG